MDPRRIGFIGFDGASSVDLSGPAEAFSCVRIGQSPGYEIRTIGTSSCLFTADCGLIFKSQSTFKNAPPLDTVIIPGGMTLRNKATADPIATFVRQIAPKTRRIVALCNGVYALAATGLIDGRRVTTHWRHAPELAALFPKVQLERDSLFIRDGKFYTSAGSAAGIDLALSLIEEDYGLRVSLSVARDLVVHFKRPGRQEQCSEPLQFQMTSVSRFSEMTTWILTHLNEELSVETLAAKACLCPRQFGRRFKTEVGITPAEFVEKARLDEARRRLSTTDATIENVAASVGFKSSDVFRRRFEQRIGLTPTEFRRRMYNSHTTSFPIQRNGARKSQLAAA